MATAWYLEKNGKFYGPFTAEKVLAYAASGKISPTTLVGTDEQGSEARPFKQLEAELLNPSATQPPKAAAAARPEPKPAAKPEPKPAAKPEPDLKVQGWESRDEEENPYGDEEADGGKEWFVCEEYGRFGPYSLGYLEGLVLSGKLPRNRKLQRQGQSALILVSELFPEPQRTPPAKNKPTSRPEAAAKKPAPPKKKAKYTVHWSVGAVILLLSMFLIVLKTSMPNDAAQNPEDAAEPPKAQAPNQVVEALKRNADSGSKLRAQVRSAQETPPYNTLVQKAVSTGLNFHYIERRVLEQQKKKAPNASQGDDLLSLHEKDLILSETQGGKQFAKWYPEQIRYEVTLVEDGAYKVTYLVGSDHYVFAVVITHDRFRRTMLVDAKQADFAPGAKVGKKFGYTSWTTEVAPGIDAMLLWQEGGSGAHLAYLCIMNQEPQRDKER